MSATPEAPLCAAPDREPRPPRRALPPGSCDTHAHICGPAARFPYAAERIYTPPDATLSDYLRLLARLGVERAVLIQPSVYGEDNAAMLDALATAGAGMRAVAVVDPEISVQAIAKLHAAGVRGLRLNVVDRREGRNVVPVETVRSLAGRIASHGWHLEFLVNLDEADAFWEATAELPVPVVIGHMGYPRAGTRNWEQSPAFERLLRALDGGQCWVKLTGPYRFSTAADVPYEDVDAVARRLAITAPERLVWGTDWPHVMMKKPMPNDGDLADLLERWLADDNTRRRVLCDNPAELYGFAADEKLRHERP